MKIVNKKAFTIVEVMIVVAVIGLLLAIAIPSLTEKKDVTNKTPIVTKMSDAKDSTVTPFPPIVYRTVIIEDHEYICYDMRFSSLNKPNWGLTHSGGCKNPMHMYNIEKIEKIEKIEREEK